MKKTLKNIESHPLHTIGLVTACIIVSIFIWSWNNSFEVSSVSADGIWCDINMCSGLPYCAGLDGLDHYSGDWNFSCVDGVGV